MDVGHLEKIIGKNKPTVYMGEVSLQGAAGELALIPKARKFKESSPDFEIKLRSPGRDWHVVGAAWIKGFKNADGSFLSLTFDHPGLSQPIYVAAFPDDPEDQPKEADEPIFYSIQWGRPKKTKEAAAADPVMNSDEIPY